MALQDNQALDVWVPVLLLLVAWVAVLARVYVRVTKKTFGSDDYVMLLGAFFFIFQCTTVIGGGVHGIGLKNQHITSQTIYIQAGQVAHPHDQRLSPELN